MEFQLGLPSNEKYNEQTQLHDKKRLFCVVLVIF